MTMTMRRTAGLALLVCAVLALALWPLLAFAQTAAPPPVVVPWGDWLAAVAPTIGVGVVGLITWALRQLPAQASGVLTAMRVDQLLARAVDYGVNVTQGAVRGRTLDVATGNAVLAAAMRYAVEQAPTIVAMAGGEALVRNKIIARLDVGEGAITQAATKAY